MRAYESERKQKNDGDEQKSGRSGATDGATDWRIRRLVKSVTAREMPAVEFDLYANAGFLKALFLYY